MANTNNNSARQTHVSPGIYFKETDLNYASKSLGITTLGLVGETVRGAAFQPMLVGNWREYQKYFGGTSTELFKGSLYPKYELPYIAKSYLQESQQLQVVRVLGLSGTNAGPAWVITASGEEDSPNNNMVVAVLRSRGEYQEAAFVQYADTESNVCEDVYEYDKLNYYAKGIKLIESKTLVLNDECTPSFTTQDGDFVINSINFGRFTIVVKLHTGEWDSDYSDTTKYKTFSVSLNPQEKNYITNVLGTTASDGDAEVYVEELYDVALKQLVEQGLLTQINKDLTIYPIVNLIPKFNSVDDLLVKDENTLSRKDVGRRYLYSKTESVNNKNGNPLKVHISKNKGVTWEVADGEAGHIYTVVAFTTPSGVREYYYGEYQNAEGGVSTDTNYKTEILGDMKYPYDEMTHPRGSKPEMDANDNTKTVIYQDVVEVKADNMFYVAYSQGDDSDDIDVYPITLDMNNYKEQYRNAITPWIVSEIKGSANDIEMTKLFRFHTISDGDASNNEIKISIENIDPETGTFDVLVRSFNDSDISPIVYERYKGCNLIPGDANYIALKIGSTDEHYETKSNYITVEVNETDKTMVSIPCGFLGYPIRDYNGLIVDDVEQTRTIPTPPYLRYNTNVDDELRINKQYFGLSDLTGIDVDILKYKGVEAYNGLPSGLSPCFHLDSHILNGKPDADGYVTQNGVKQRVTVDTITGYEWVTVNRSNVTSYGIEPRIGDSGTIINTIYEDKRYRKFTVCFYGGYDGWDYYRRERSTGDEFKYNKYKGNLDKVSGVGTSFSVIKNPEVFGFDNTEKCLNSDWYAYLGAINTLSNPNDIEINVLATPGIDYVNQKSLVDEVIDIVENKRADCIYVVTTPDKPKGSDDSEGSMYTPDEAVWNLEDSEIDSNYACTYYPWVKYFDEDNNKYIYLPPTCDIVRNYAYTDNTRYPWFAPAGWERGVVNGVRPRKTLVLSEEDTLYGGRINFIKKFAQEGMRIWGDNNLQVRESVMNKISKRRLLLRIRKLCSIACISLVFDPNDNTLVQSFRSAVEPVLNDILSNRGITDWKIEIDDSAEARDRLELPAKIYIKPTPNVEYIDINFIITPQGTNWDNI